MHCGFFIKAIFAWNVARDIASDGCVLWKLDQPSHYYIHCFIYNVYIIIFYGIKELKNVFHECHLADWLHTASVGKHILIYIHKYVWVCSIEKSHVSRIFSDFIAAWNLWIPKKSMLGFALSWASRSETKKVLAAINVFSYTFSITFLPFLLEQTITLEAYHPCCCVHTHTQNSQPITIIYSLKL